MLGDQPLTSFLARGSRLRHPKGRVLDSAIGAIPLLSYSSGPREEAVCHFNDNTELSKNISSVKVRRPFPSPCRSDASCGRKGHEKAQAEMTRMAQADR